ncbi:MAG TPA: nucleotide exchange factor GrpE [Caulobacteraceae bacterium]
MKDEDLQDTRQDGEDEVTADAGDIDGLRAELAGLKDQALRFAAEAENTRRRAEREINDARAYAIQKFARDLLGVADNLSRALAHAPKEGEETPARSLAVGLEMTQKELLSAFERNGLKRLSPAAGERFDPHRHQAMTEQTSADVPPGTVIEVLQDGYELFGRIVRPAMVVVAARDSTGPSPQSAAAGAPA